MFSNGILCKTISVTFFLLAFTADSTRGYPGDKNDDNSDSFKTRNIRYDPRNCRKVPYPGPANHSSKLTASTSGGSSVKHRKPIPDNFNPSFPRVTKVTTPTKTPIVAKEGTSEIQRGFFSFEHRISMEKNKEEEAIPLLESDASGPKCWIL